VLRGREIFAAYGCCRHYADLVTEHRTRRAQRPPRVIAASPIAAQESRPGDSLTGLIFVYHRHSTPYLVPLRPFSVIVSGVVSVNTVLQPRLGRARADSRYGLQVCFRASVTCTEVAPLAGFLGRRGGASHARLGPPSCVERSSSRIPPSCPLPTRSLITTHGSLALSPSGYPHGRRLLLEVRRPAPAYCPLPELCGLKRQFVTISLLPSSNNRPRGRRRLRFSVAMRWRAPAAARRSSGSDPFPVAMTSRRLPSRWTFPRPVDGAQPRRTRLPPPPSTSRRCRTRSSTTMVWSALDERSAPRLSIRPPDAADLRNPLVGRLEPYGPVRLASRKASTSGCRATRAHRGASCAYLVGRSRMAPLSGEKSRPRRSAPH